MLGKFTVHITSYNLQILKIQNISVMDQLNSLFSQNRQRPKRPQTPIVGQPYKGQPNRSFNQMPPYSPTKYPTYNYNNNPKGLTKSRASVASSASQLELLNADQGELFPEDLVFLLKNEEKNINQFKQKIEREKSKVENDFSVFRTQIEHVLEDLKISVQAQLDFVYKSFITKYAEIKGEVQELRKMRKEILMTNQMNSNKIGHNEIISNKDLISEIEKDAEHFRNYRIYGYLSQLQKQKLVPILQIANQLILIGSADCPFYRGKEMQGKLRSIKDTFTGTIGSVYANLNDFIVTPQAIIEKEKFEEEQDNMILQHLENEQLIKQFPQTFQPQPQPQMVSENHQYLTPSQSVEFKKPKVEVKHVEKRQKLNYVSNTQTCSVVKWGESVGLGKIERIVTDHEDAILCIFFVGNYIATGSKDKTINIYTLTGQKVTTLRGHNAAICSLATIASRSKNLYLASGSDHGCCCLILWNTDTWTISSRIQSHTAAVTCILDLEDGQHLLTGSYDKKINLFSHLKGQLIFSTNNKSAVTSMGMSSDKRRLVSAGLDNSLIIWNIFRNNNIVQSIQADRMIKNSSLICSLEPSILIPDMVVAATRDGKVKIYNISTGELQRVYAANESSIIELVVIERQMKNNSPLVLTCSSKDKCLTLTKMDSGLSESVKVNGAFHIEFGCGIGPKIVTSIGRGGMIAILSQSSQAKEFSLYEIDIK